MATSKPIRTVADYRNYLGDTANDYSDEELLQALATGTGTPLHEAAEKFGYDTAKGPWTENVSSSVDKYQAGLYGLGESVAGAVGADSLSSFMAKRRRANEISAGISSTRAHEIGGITNDFRNINGPSSLGSYIGDMAVNAAPNLAELAAGGMAGRGLRLLAGGARAGSLAAGSVEAADAARNAGRAGTAGAVAATYPSSVGSILDSQRQQTENEPGGPRTNLGTAALLGIPDAALNANLGVGALAAKSQLPRIATPILDNLNGVGGRVARAAATGIGSGIEQAGVGAGQAALGQLGRMSVDDQAGFMDPAAQKRYLDAAVGGFAFGGAVGGALSGGRRSAHYTSPMDMRSDVVPDRGPANFDALNRPPPPAPPRLQEPDGSYNFAPDNTAPGLQDLLQPRQTSYPRQTRNGQDVNNTIPPDLTLAPPGSQIGDNGIRPGAPVRPQSFDYPNDPRELDRRNSGPLTGGIDRANGIDYYGDTGDLALAQTARPEVGHPEQPLPVPPDQAVAPSDKPAANTELPPVQHSGTPEAIARTAETEARKVAATDAIARAQTAGMVSEKQQSHFWRAEQLAKEGKLSPDETTQVTALLMQQKFGVAKKMLDDAAAGNPRANLEAKLKAVDDAHTEYEKQSSEAAAKRAEWESLRDAKAPAMEGKPEQVAKKTKAWETKNAVATAKAKVAYDAAQARETAAAQNVAALKKTVTPAEPAPPAPTVAGPKGAAALKSIKAEAKATGTAALQKIKAQAETTKKITRYEALLACLKR